MRTAGMTEGRRKNTQKDKGRGYEMREVRRKRKRTGVGVGEWKVRGRRMIQNEEESRWKRKRREILEF